jgi:hypothetical protein
VNIWQRGLLKKGLGLCHGISGNGYAFLSAYRATRDVTSYQQAQAFGLYGAEVRPSHTSRTGHVFLAHLCVAACVLAAIVSKAHGTARHLVMLERKACR